MKNGEDAVTCGRFFFKAFEKHISTPDSLFLAQSLEKAVLRMTARSQQSRLDNRPEGLAPGSKGPSISPEHVEMRAKMLNPMPVERRR